MESNAAVLLVLNSTAWNFFMSCFCPDIFSNFHNHVPMLIRFNRKKPLSGRERARKAVLIANVVQQAKPPDVETLRQIAIRDGGFFSAHCRADTVKGLAGTLKLADRL
jgi:hypothetical protein